MSPRRIGLALVMAGVAAAAPGPATGQNADPPGLMSLSGGGTVVMDGEATVIGFVRGPAILVVFDRLAGAGAVSLRVGGREVAPLAVSAPDGFATVRRYRVPRRAGRRFLLTSDDMRARILAGTMSLSVSGRLRVRLRGAGVYRLDGGSQQAWDPSVRVPVGLPTRSTVPSVTVGAR